MPFVVRRRNPDRGSGIILSVNALHRGRDRFAHRREQVADDLIMVEQAGFDLLVPLFDLGLGHPGLLRFGKRLIV